MIEEFFLSRMFSNSPRPPPFLCIRFFGHGLFPCSIPCRSRYRARCVPQHTITAPFLPGFLFFIEKQGVRVLQKFISYLSGTHTVSSYLTRWAFFDPIAIGGWAQKYPARCRARPTRKAGKSMHFKADTQQEAPAHPCLRSPPAPVEPKKQIITLSKQIK